ncbi:pyruvate, water dikinase regulatory protein [Salisediminibacterium halotolerans]|uniref:pyruvate, water dikinase regulatory protein n=1 Tax=Salisediminibacterium halotolerans TaxID=517425 RepID=UPI000EAD52FE|nr:pyruvate, water dikinase regulatory protein [Salisediminibacterium halotolerans]RLJ71729.1 hypothetical protein BCL39_2401 [Actinophytocola xinjiangensis]RPE86879.1 hypothetical protein EDD67_1742 [Salisediminibacterium halotolerans]TWG32942.1 hypothetical protein BCL52_2396 [Salisediminibacterium halotolerans]GEL08208.1 putative pyruvate, phosphate dikinase regulatory protein 1 [Salisediminibacterium halotolerans]
MNKTYHLFIVSDSVGETAHHLVQAVSGQFPQQQTVFHRYPYMKRLEEIDRVIAEAKDYPSLIVFTVIVPELKEYLLQQAEHYGIEAVDVMAPLMNAFGKVFDSSPKLEPGYIRRLGDDYFRRIAAIEFAVKYDDAQEMSGINNADIVLAGVSRTSKTPLSMYLANKGYYAANIPIIPEVPPPKDIFSIPKEKMIGLMISPEKLLDIRRERLRALGLKQDSSYADRKRILAELDFAADVLNQIGCPVIDVSNKAVEETAQDLLERMTPTGGGIV